MLNNLNWLIVKGKSKTSLGQMFSIESALVKITLVKWFNVKYLRQFTNIDPFKKLSYEQKNPIKWNKQKCVICKFPLKLNPTNY